MSRLQETNARYERTKRDRLMTEKQKRLRVLKERKRLKSKRQGAAEKQRRLQSIGEKFVHYNRESIRQLLGNSICMQFVKRLRAEIAEIEALNERMHL